MGIKAFNAIRRYCVVYLISIVACGFLFNYFVREKNVVDSIFFSLVVLCFNLFILLIVFIAMRLTSE